MSALIRNILVVLGIGLFFAICVLTVSLAQKGVIEWPLIAAAVGTILVIVITDNVHRYGRLGLLSVTYSIVNGLCYFSMFSMVAGFTMWLSYAGSHAVLAAWWLVCGVVSVSVLIVCEAIAKRLYAKLIGKTSVDRIP
jgi:hypothetical protein